MQELVSQSPKFSLALSINSTDLSRKLKCPEADKLRCGYAQNSGNGFAEFKIFFARGGGGGAGWGGGGQEKDGRSSSAGGAGDREGGSQLFGWFPASKNLPPPLPPTLPLNNLNLPTPMRIT